MESRKNYFPGLDGLRGLAILCVMTYHFFDSRFTIDQSSTWDINPFRFGWVGVDLFFVISGFLITDILLSQKSKPHFFRNFFLRRTLRIFPLYFGFLFVFFILPRILNLALPSSWEKLWARQGFFWFYLADIYTIWFDSWPEFSLSHFWSLGIEEKFYLFWPFTVFTYSKKGLKYICFSLIFISFLSKIILLKLHTNGVLINYTFPICRLEGLAVGAFLAIRKSENQVLGFISVKKLLPFFVLVYFGIYLIEKTLAPMTITMQLIGFPVNAALGFLLVHNALNDKSYVLHLVNNRALKLLGKYSYALYLLHLPLLGLLLKISPNTSLNFSIPFFIVPFLLWIALCVACAWLSWTVWEQPFLKLKKHFQ